MFLKKRPQAPNNRFYRLDSSHVAAEPRRRQVYDYYREPPAQRAMSRLILILIIIAALVIGQSIFQIPWLALKNITVEGLPDIPRDQLDQRIQPILEKRRWLIFKNNNYWLFKPFDLEQQLTTDLWVKNPKIQKRFPNSLLVSGAERIIPFVRQTPEKFIQLDYRGQEAGDLASTTPSMRIIADERTDRSQWIGTAYLERATVVVNAWSFPPSVINITKFHLSDDARQITISTSRGYKLLLSSEEDIAAQIQRLKELLDQNVIPANIQYIDFRFGDHVYFK
ncbi:MAG: FtsQ-type POTRA domain-containing protein [Candidatus Komeilibacteria bacterium]